jgi:hypothetical protein
VSPDDETSSRRSSQNAKAAVQPSYRPRESAWPAVSFSTTGKDRESLSSIGVRHLTIYKVDPVSFVQFFLVHRFSFMVNG